MCKRNKVNIFIWIVVIVLGWSNVSYSEDEPKHFVSSSLFMLANFAPDPPSFYQLNYGHRVTKRDTFIIEAITWTYEAPLGIPYADMGDAKNQFNGHVRDIGVGLAYQRYWWKGLYSMMHMTPFWQLYYDEQAQHLQSGFQLFLTFRTGYHFAFWKNRIFIEPSVAFTTWPININLPKSFAEKEAKWPSYFLFEPGLHIGVNF